MLGGILFGEGNGQLAISDIGNVERCKAGRNPVVRECASPKRVRGKVRVKHIYRAVVEVGHIKVVGAARRGQSNSFIDGISTTAVVDHQLCSRAGVPSRDGSVLGGKEEVRGSAGDLEVCRAVINLSRRGPRV